MNRKYSNIFWHQGIKDYIQINGRQIDPYKSNYFENDVTKSLLNVLEQCDNSILKSILK